MATVVDRTRLKLATIEKKTEKSAKLRVWQSV